MTRDHGVLDFQLPPGFTAEPVTMEAEDLSTPDLDLIMVQCVWCGKRDAYDSLAYSISQIQAAALRHRVDCHTPLP